MHFITSLPPVNNQNYKILLSNLSRRKVFDTFNLIRHFLLNDKDRFLYFINSATDTNRLLSLVYNITNRSMVATFNDLLAIDDTVIFIPFEEDEIQQFYLFLDKNKSLTSHIKYLLPPYESFLIARDKGALADFCLKHSIATPCTFHPDILDNTTLPCDLPLIAKKRFGEGAKGQVIIDDQSKLQKFMHKYDRYDFIIQKYIARPEVSVKGAFYLYNAGHIVSWTGHRRIRTYPKRGGVSVYSERILDDDLRDAGAHILNKLSWSGLAMLEFLFDERDRTYKLIEINPRIWGSVLLSSELVKKYIEILTGNTLNTSLPDKRYLDWLLPGEILYLLSSKNISEFISNLVYVFRRRRETYFINISYSDFVKTVLFLLYQLTSKSNYDTLIQKIRV